MRLRSELLDNPNSMPARAPLIQYSPNGLSFPTVVQILSLSFVSSSTCPLIVLLLSFAHSLKALRYVLNSSTLNAAMFDISSTTLNLSLILVDMSLVVVSMLTVANLGNNFIPPLP